jgi:hypothetical protein
VSLCLAFLPVFYYLKCADIEEAVNLWVRNGIEIGLGSSILWLLYKIGRDKSLDSIVAYTFLCQPNLLPGSICGHMRMFVYSRSFGCGSNTTSVYAYILLYMMKHLYLNVLLGGNHHTGKVCMCSFWHNCLAVPGFPSCPILSALR